MSTRSEAEENLRTIRSLMERSTIYRAISAPTALVGGVLSIVACVTYYLKFQKPKTFGYEQMFANYFLVVWLGTLVLTAAANTYFIWRGAKLRSEPFISSGMKLALISLLPPMICAGVFTAIVSPYPDAAHVLPTLWMICYGLGLLSTSHFAPRSITLLGWTFLVSGFLSIFILRLSSPNNSPGTYYTFNFMMGATFGLYHLIYAACTWPRKNTGTITTIPGGEP